eukprot:SAG11_NODE_16169_length_555_cov_1.239035_1_plen_112_part_10
MAGGRSVGIGGGGGGDAQQPQPAAAAAAGEGEQDGHELVAVGVAGRTQARWYRYESGKGISTHPDRELLERTLHDWVTRAVGCDVDAVGRRAAPELVFRHGARGPAGRSGWE